jgi:hypothetical protein
MKIESPYKLLAEELEQEVKTLNSLLKQKQQILEGDGFFPAGEPEKIGDPINGSIFPTNTGSVSGVKPYTNIAGASDAVPWNPGAVSSLQKGKGQFAFAKADPYTVPSKPNYTNNVGFGMGFGQSDQHFQQSRDFVNQYAGDQFDTDDPTEDSKISWQKMNSAVHSYTTQNLKSMLSQWNLVDTNIPGAPYQSALSDKYNLFDPSLSMRKKVQSEAEKILGVKSKGTDVQNKMKKLAMDRMVSIWKK